MQNYPTIEVKKLADGSKARFCGILTCGHIWTCPVCSARLRGERAERIKRAVDVAGGRWQMLTVTLRHRDGMPLKRLLDGLMRAWRRTRQGGKIQRVWTGRVSASARAIEITRGPNGWHPHLHVLLRTSEWTDEERAALLARWCVAVVRELGAECTPDDAHALTWSEAFEAADERGRARYLAKLGLELGGFGKDDDRSHWRIALRAADGDQTALKQWWEYSNATRGRRMLELDDRASAYADRYAIEPRDDVESAPVIVVELWPDEVLSLRTGEARMPGFLDTLLRDCETSANPRETVRTWLAWCGVRRARAGPAPRASCGYT